METTKATPTASQIELLMSDWMANLREQGSFVHKNTKGAIARKKSSNYSDYFMGDISNRSELEVLKNAREIAQGMVDSMTSVPVKVLLGTADSFTDGCKITLASDYFDSKGLSVGDKIDILCGFAIHEASHINYTDFKEGYNFVHSMPEPLRPIVKAIQNTLDDERIEYLTGEERPGLSDFIATVKEYEWKKYGPGKEGINEGITEPLPRFLNTLLAAVRFPSMLTEEDVVENYNELCQIRDILMPYPLTYEGVNNATRRILEVMKDIIRLNLQQKKEKEQQQNQQQQDQSGQQQNGTGSGTDTPSAKDVNEALEQAMASGQMQKVLEKINNITGDGNKPKNDQHARCLRKSSDDNMYVNGDAEKLPADGAGGGSIRYIKQVGGNANSYMASYKKVKPYVAAIRKALTCKTQMREYELRGERSGKLNTGKLASLKVGNKNLFTKQGEVTCSRASVCILIDESGSMDARRKNAARETAILIKEAVKGVDNLDLYIYGYGSNCMKVYAENNKEKRYALGSIDNDGGTPTGPAMEVALKKMSKHPNPAALMLVITDGVPDDNDAVRQADSKLRKKGVIPVGIGIDGCTAVQDIFQESIVYTELSTLASELGKITKKKLVRMLERKDSVA